MQSCPEPAKDLSALYQFYDDLSAAHLSDASHTRSLNFFLRASFIHHNQTSRRLYIILRELFPLPIQGYGSGVGVLFYLSTFTPRQNAT